MLCSPALHLSLPAALGGVVTCSLHSFSSDRSNTLNRSSFARDSMMIEEILAPTKDTVRSISLVSVSDPCSASTSNFFLIKPQVQFVPLCPLYLWLSVAVVCQALMSLVHQSSSIAYFLRYFDALPFHQWSG